MFSGLASYLFGSSSTTADTPIDTNPITATEELTETQELENYTIVKKKSKRNRRKSNKPNCDKTNKSLTSEDSDDDWLFIEKNDGNLIKQFFEKKIY